MLLIYLWKPHLSTNTGGKPGVSLDRCSQYKQLWICAPYCPIAQFTSGRSLTIWKVVISTVQHNYVDRFDTTFHSPPLLPYTRLESSTLNSTALEKADSLRGYIPHSSTHSSTHSSSHLSYTRLESSTLNSTAPMKVDSLRGYIPHLSTRSSTHSSTCSSSHSSTHITRAGVGAQYWR